MNPKPKSRFRKAVAIGTLGATMITMAPDFPAGQGPVSAFLARLDSSAAAARAEYPVWDRNAIRKLVVKEAMRNGTVPPALALAVAKIESDFQSKVKSYAGARGVMQIMPATAWGEFRVAEEQLWDPETNVRIGIAFLARLYRTYGNRWDLALSHYNGGSLKKVAGRHVVHSYTRDYVKKVTTHWRRFQRENVVAQLIDYRQPDDGRFHMASSSSERIAGRPRADDTDTRTSMLVRDHWLLEDPKGRAGWRDYLKVAERWLKRGKPTPAVSPSQASSDMEVDRFRRGPAKPAYGDIRRFR